MSKWKVLVLAILLIKNFVFCQSKYFNGKISYRIDEIALKSIEAIQINSQLDSVLLVDFDDLGCQRYISDDFVFHIPGGTFESDSLEFDMWSSKFRCIYSFYDNNIETCSLSNREDLKIFDIYKTDLSRSIAGYMTDLYCIEVLYNTSNISDVRYSFVYLSRELKTNPRLTELSGLTFFHPLNKLVLGYCIGISNKDSKAFILTATEIVAGNNILFDLKNNICIDSIYNEMSKMCK